MALALALLAVALLHAKLESRTESLRGHGTSPSRVMGSTKFENEAKSHVVHDLRGAASLKRGLEGGDASVRNRSPPWPLPPLSAYRIIRLADPA